MKPLKSRTVIIDDENSVNTTDPGPVIDLLNQINSRLSLREDLSDRLDLLVYKIDKIEESQEKILEQVNSISVQVYEPDNGLYARIKTSEKKFDEKISKIDKDLCDLNDDSINQKKILNEIKESLKLSSESQIKIDHSIHSLMKWKTHLNSGFKWVALAILSPILAYLGKYITDVMLK